MPGGSEVLRSVSWKDPQLPGLILLSGLALSWLSQSSRSSCVGSVVEGGGPHGGPRLPSRRQRMWVVETYIPQTSGSEAQGGQHRPSSGHLVHT
jgi:hypothetical protein